MDQPQEEEEVQDQTYPGHDDSRDMPLSGC